MIHIDRSEIYHCESHVVEVEDVEVGVSVVGAFEGLIVIVNQATEKEASSEGVDVEDTKKEPGSRRFSGSAV